MTDKPIALVSMPTLSGRFPSFQLEPAQAVPGTARFCRATILSLHVFGDASRLADERGAGGSVAEPHRRVDLDQGCVWRARGEDPEYFEFSSATSAPSASSPGCSIGFAPYPR